jgi:hypothetical protein
MYYYYSKVWKMQGVMSAVVMNTGSVFTLARLLLTQIWHCRLPARVLHT